MTLLDDLGNFVDKYSDAVYPSGVVMGIRSHANRLPSQSPIWVMHCVGPAVMAVMEIQVDDSVPNATIGEEVKVITGKAGEAIGKKGLYPDGVATFNANIASGREKVQDIFGENMPRLRESKKKYDPKFLLNKWCPVPPVQ